MVFMLRPRSGPGQWLVREEYELTPAVPVTEVTDTFGNLCQRLVAPVGEFRVATSTHALVSPCIQPAEVADYVRVQDLPADALPFLLPSRYCESDRFGTMAAEIVAGQPRGYPQVAAICDWVRDNIRNTPLSSTYPVSATEVNQRGEGVCRDLSHMAISLCRGLTIPARLVVGYLQHLEPMDIHAWFEAFVGGQWWTFDPSVVDQEGYRLAIARGRDATDVAIYNQYGPLLLPTQMQISVTEIPIRD